MAGGHYADQAAPARKWLAVTPSDSVNLPAGCRGLFVTSAGNLSLQGTDGSALVFTLADAGRVLPIGPVRVNATNTTATGIIALY